MLASVSKFAICFCIIVLLIPKYTGIDQSYKSYVCNILPQAPPGKIWNFELADKF